MQCTIRVGGGALHAPGEFMGKAVAVGVLVAGPSSCRGAGWFSRKSYDCKFPPRNEEIHSSVWSCVLRLLVAAAGLPLLLGCAAVRTVPALPEESQLARDQLIINSDFKLPKRHRLVEEVAALRGDVSRLLDIPVSDEPIHVYLFEDRAKYQEYISKHYPDLESRRAFFVETDTRLTVYAHWGDQVAEDLRHEVTHGYLHAVIPNMPLWIDEGLAEYFETPRGWDGLHIPHLRLLESVARAGWEPDMPRLEQKVQLGEMLQQDYAESWLWIHFLLSTTRERRLLLQNHLAVQRDRAQAPRLSAALLTLEPDVSARLLEHLRKLAAANRVE